MPIDTSSYAAAAGAPKTFADYQVENQQVQQNALNLQSGRQKLDAYTTDQNMLNQFRGVFASGVDPMSTEGQSRLNSIDPVRAAAYFKTQQDQATSRALANKDQGAADESSQKIKDQAFAHYQNALGTIQTPDEAARFITASFHDPIIGPMLQSRGTLEQGLQILQDHSASPDAFKQWLGTASMGMEKIAADTKVNQINTGGTTNTQTYNPITNQTQTVASVQNTVAPDTAANNATSRSNNAANIAKDYKVAGLDGQGNSVGGIGAAQGLIDGIGKGVVSEAVALGRATPSLKAQVLTGLATQYPAYVPGQFDAQKHAILAFGSGPLGQNIQTGNTALNHLATLKELASAEANGNTPLFNQIANAYGRETGQAAPTNLQSALTMVGPELTKAVVGAGGGEGDRENTIKALSALSKGSPAQAAGTLATIEDIFGGRLSEQARTYQRTTGQSNFNDLLSPASQAVLARHSGGGATAVPTIGGFTTDAIAAELANRKHK